MKHIIVLTILIFCSILSNAQLFTCGTDTVTDIDGNVYHTVQIGQQCWMKENMRTTRYSNGMPVSVQEIASSDFSEIINMPGKLHVQVFHADWQRIPISIYDMTGQVIYQADFNWECFSFSIRLSAKI